MVRSGTKDLTLHHLHDDDRVYGLTHGFYRYPATTSPRIIRELLLNFTERHDVVVDPFMGGGTTVVEALAHGRRVLGIDVNPVAVLATRAKTTPLSARAWSELAEWAESDPMRGGEAGTRHDERTRNLPPALKRAMGTALESLTRLSTAEQRLMARCALLNVARWACEARDRTPDRRLLSRQLALTVRSMETGMRDLLDASREHAVGAGQLRSRRVLVRGAAESAGVLTQLKKFSDRASIVLTSPPYPGVHVLYHRWQIHGRRETPAPYWIIGARDGHGSAYYTLGGRSKRGSELYFERLRAVYTALRPLLRRDAIVAQLVAFHSADEQRSHFLEAMDEAGFDHLYAGAENLVRPVPNRRWYARGQAFDAAEEHLIIHRVRAR